MLCTFSPSAQSTAHWYPLPVRYASLVSAFLTVRIRHRDLMQYDATSKATAALELFEREDFPAQVRAIAPAFEARLHALKGRPHVVDIRNYGLAGAIQLAPREGDPAIRPRDAALALWEAGFYVRYGGDTLQFGPPFATTDAELERLFDAVATTLDTLA